MILDSKKSSLNTQIMTKITPKLISPISSKFDHITIQNNFFSEKVQKHINVLY